MDGSGRPPRQLLIHDVAQQVREVRSLLAREERTPPHLRNHRPQARIGRGERRLGGAEAARGEWADGGPSAHILLENMMCALGVPASISHGWVSDGVVESPVLCGVAKGVYTTNSRRPPVTVFVLGS